MSNPLDDAFAKAESERAAEDLVKLAKEQATEAAIRDWLREYREVLAAIPRHVQRAPEEITLSWSPKVEPPSPVQAVGTGRDRRRTALAVGSCEAWRFTKIAHGEKSRTEFFVSSDCAAIFETGHFTTVKIRRSLGRGALAQALGSFADLRTGRHTLRLDASPGSGDRPYHVWLSSLPSPETVAQIIAEQELPSQ